MARPPLDGTILVTGASSGIGRALARLLAVRAETLVLVARRRERLQALADELRAARPGLKVSVKSCDLADPAAATQLAEEVESELGTVDVLVNNAGLGDFELFEHTQFEKLERMIQVNVLALTRLTHHFLPRMLLRARGGILNVSSGLGLTFLPGFAAYGASKHFVTAFSEALRLELHGTGVVVSQLCPGPVATEFLELSGNPTGREIPSAIQLSAERCAELALRGFARGRALIVPGLLMKLVIGLGRITPRWMRRVFYRWIGGYLRRRRG